MVTLPSGKEIEVRRLHFLEIEDNVPYDVEPPYTHRYDNGQEAQYILADWDSPPEMPKEPFSMAQPGSELFARWETYSLYQAVLLHEKRRAEQIEQYLVNVARYIRKYCISPDVLASIETPDDYTIIKNAAICPEVQREDLEAELASTFQG